MAPLGWVYEQAKSVLKDQATHPVVETFGSRLQLCTLYLEALRSVDLEDTSMAEVLVTLVLPSIAMDVGADDRGGLVFRHSSGVNKMSSSAMFRYSSPLAVPSN